MTLTAKALAALCAAYVAGTVTPAAVERVRHKPKPAVHRVAKPKPKPAPIAPKLAEREPCVITLGPTQLAVPVQETVPLFSVPTISVPQEAATQRTPVMGGGPIEIGPWVLHRPPTVDGAVPEPGSWLMLLAGMGVVGMAMRKREKEVRNG